MKTVLTIMKKEFARIFKDKRLVLSLILPGVFVRVLVGLALIALGCLLSNCY